MRVSINKSRDEIITIGSLFTTTSERRTVHENKIGYNTRTENPSNTTHNYARTPGQVPLSGTPHARNTTTRTQPQLRTDGHGYTTTTSDTGYECVFCSKSCIPVHTPTGAHEFVHADGTQDCSRNDSANDPHKAAVEHSCKALAEILPSDTSTRETFSPSNIKFQAEKQVGTQQTVTADLLVGHPVNAAVEVFNMCKDLSLPRRLNVFFENGYDVYLVFVVPGCHNPRTVERHMQQIACVPGIQVGTYNKFTGEITLGTRLSPFVIDVDGLQSDTVPAYLA